MINPLLILIAAVVVIVVFDGARHRILFKIGLRNINRRKMNTLIVVLGLMIGTAIISSSLGIGDTMDNFVESEIYDDWDETDITVYNRTASGQYQMVPMDTYGDFREDVLSLDDVEGIGGELHFSVSAFDRATKLTETSVSVMGINRTESDALGGFYENGKKIDFSLENDEIYIDPTLSDDLEAQEGDELVIYSEVYPQGRPLTVKGIIDDEGRASWGGDGKIITSLETARELRGTDGGVNFIRISCTGGPKKGLDKSSSVADEVRGIIEGNREEYGMLEVQGVKKEEMDSLKSSLSQFTDLFLVFGTFAIIAGVILTINIFVMLGEERKSEMGMSRAIGMKRGHLRRVFSYEGLFYSLGAAIIGAVLGIGVTYIIFYLLQDVFAGFGATQNMLSYFDYEIGSLITSFSAGFIITMGTILFSVFRISKMNIVRAIREIPEPPVHKKSRKVLYLASIALTIGLVLTAIGMSAEQLWIPTTGVSLVIIGLGAITRRWVGDRAAFTGVGIFLLIWWLAPFEFFDASTADIEMFIISGLFQVTAAVMIVMLNGSVITKGLESICRSGKGFKAVILSAVSHPMKEKFRTAMTMFIFALIIFSITTMGMIVGIFDSNIDRMIEEQSGGYDIVGITDTNRPINGINGRIRDSNNLSLDDFKEIDSCTIGVTATNRTSDGRPHRMQIIGVDSDFVDNQSFGFADYAEGYVNRDEVWRSVMDNSSRVIVHSSGQGFGPPGTGGPSAGDRVTLLDKNGMPREKLVIGELNQTIVQGAFMSKSTAREEFNVTATSLFFMEVEEGVDADELAKTLEKEFINYGFQPIVLQTIFEQAMSSIYFFFDLFSGYMGLGLVVGIAGLGIISLRAVHERRLEIGMMRAIGFKKRMISYAFLIENSFITIMGIVIGTLLGIATGWQLWVDSFKPMGWEFYIPWMRILIVGIIAYVIMLVTAIPSAQKASNVSPAEALRFD